MHSCPLCKGPLKIHHGDEGTSHYYCDSEACYQAELKKQLVSGPPRSGYAADLSGEIIEGLDSLYLSQDETPDIRKLRLYVSFAHMEEAYKLFDHIEALQAPLDDLQREQIAIMSEQNATNDRYMEETKKREVLRKEANGWINRLRRCETEKEGLALENLNLKEEIASLRKRIAELPVKLRAGVSAHKGNVHRVALQLTEELLSSPPAPSPSQQ